MLLCLISCSFIEREMDIRFLMFIKRCPQAISCTHLSSLPIPVVETSVQSSIRVNVIGSGSYKLSSTKFHVRLDYPKVPNFYNFSCL